jgi:hypothetical protein
MGNFLSIPESATIQLLEQVASSTIGGLYPIDVSVANAAFGWATDIWGRLKSVFSWLSPIWSKLRTLIRDLLHGAFRKFLADLTLFLHQLRDKLAKWLKPLTDWIKFEKWWLDQVYKNVIKPMLDLIQRVRMTLTVFRLLHVKWAEQLDQYLADLQGQITAAFLRAENDINTLARWVNYIIDPTGIFNPALLFLSQLQTLPALWSALKALPSAAIGAVDAQAQQVAAASGKRTNVIAEIQSRANGPTADDLTRQIEIRALYQADGYFGGT